MLGFDLYGTFCLDVHTLNGTDASILVPVVQETMFGCIGPLQEGTEQLVEVVFVWLSVLQGLTLDIFPLLFVFICGGKPAGGRCSILLCVWCLTGTWVSRGPGQVAYITIVVASFTAWWFHVVAQTWIVSCRALKCSHAGGHFAPLQWVVTFCFLVVLGTFALCLF